MHESFGTHAARLRGFIGRASLEATSARAGGPGELEPEFNELARELFNLQFGFNLPYRAFCQARGLSPAAVTGWRQVPAVPAAAFKEFELTCLPEAERTRVFHSSGTTQQPPARHFHSAASLALYEDSLRPWWRKHLLPEGGEHPPSVWVSLTPPAREAPHSSLVHMIATLFRDVCPPGSRFAGKAAPDGAWVLDHDDLLCVLHRAADAGEPVGLLGTAFGFVQLLDHLTERGLRLSLPTGSRLMETGGYKGRSRELPRAELHARLSTHLGIPASHIVGEYGMSELSSQAYDGEVRSVRCEERTRASVPDTTRQSSRVYRFPPWARVRIVSPEDGREVRDGESGLIQVVDLANAWSAMAIQTEDLGVRRGDGFELVGRAPLAEPRGCSLMAASGG